MNDKLLKARWKVQSEHAYECFPIFTPKRSERINPRSGKIHAFFLIDGLDWANIIALTPKNEVVLVRQYRHGGDVMTTELPGGCVEKNEDPGASAQRELSEETGYSCSSITHLGTLFPNPALMSIRQSVYIGRDAVCSGGQELDPGEDIEVLTVPLSEALAMVRRGEIAHALMVAAFGLLTLNHPELTK